MCQAGLLGGVGLAGARFASDNDGLWGWDNTCAQRRYHAYASPLHILYTLFDEHTELTNNTKVWMR